MCLRKHLSVISVLCSGDLYLYASGTYFQMPMKAYQEVSHICGFPLFHSTGKCVVSDASATGKTDELFIDSVTKSMQAKKRCSFC